MADNPYCLAAASVARPAEIVTRMPGDQASVSILTRLRRAARTIRAGTLAERAGMSKQAMNQLLRSLEGLGYIVRSDVPEEGRTRIVRFTKRGHAEALMPLIARVMKASGIAFSGLDRIAVTTGPGSFTGLRVGLSAARGIALAADRPVVGVCRLDSRYRARSASQR